MPSLKLGEGLLVEFRSEGPQTKQVGTDPGKAGVTFPRCRICGALFRSALNKQRRLDFQSQRMGLSRKAEAANSFHLCARSSLFPLQNRNHWPAIEKDP